MSAYSGRSGVNVSQYLANLNSICSPQQEATEPQTREDDFRMFMNADFFESFDTNAANVDIVDVPLDLSLDTGAHHTSQANPTNTTVPSASESDMDFNINGDFQFADFSSFVDPSLQGLPQSQTGTFAVGPSYTSPISAVSPSTSTFDSAPKKRKLDNADQPSQQAIDEAARVAAEEDKRRRNTAASARFRIKKKQREQALEKTAKQMSEKVSILEARIQQLETENVWLKGLITEKNGGKATASELVEKLSRMEESGERNTGNRTDGVGTKDKETKA